MKKIYYLGMSVLALLANMTSCSDVDSLSIAEQKGAITFQAVSGKTINTRVAETEDVAGIASFKVFAKWSEDGVSGFNFFSGQEITGSSSGTVWTYLPAKYWPQSGDAAFYAYSPYNSTYVNTPFTLAGDYDGDPTLVYTVPATAQEDFLVASAKAGPLNESYVDPVQFQFSHALSQLKFSAKSVSENLQFVIHSIKVKGLNSRGTLTYDYDAQTYSWGSQDTPLEYAPVVESTTIEYDAVVGNFQSLTATGEGLAFLPQTVEDKAISLELTYRVDVDTEPTPFEAEFSFDNQKATVLLPALTFAPGYRYNVQLALGKETATLHKVEFSSIGLADWSDAGEGTKTDTIPYFAPVTLNGAGDPTFNYIKAGSFSMGSPENESGRSTNEKQHPVTLTKDFYMGETPVTRAQFVEFLNDVNESLTPQTADIQSNTAITYNGHIVFNAGHGISRSSGTWIVAESETSPVDYVSWYGANDYIEWLEGKLQLLLPPIPTAFGLAKVSLPTDAQWEYACRAGTTEAHYWDIKSGAIDDYAWYGTSAVHEVKGKLPNAWGLYDMNGNVIEWCSDWLTTNDSNYNDYVGTSAGQIDPTGVSETANKVLRGGGFSDPAPTIRSAARIYAGPATVGQRFGFRVVLIPN
jgi:formylglycine-generating enzyme required for sulfatase activity